VTVTGSAMPFPILTTLTDVNLTADGGAVITFPMLGSFSGGEAVTIQANGSNSRIDLSNASSIGSNKTFTVSGGGEIVLGGTITNCNINLDGVGSKVTFARTTHHTGVMTITGGTLTGPGDVTFAGTLNWSGGAMTGTGRTIIGSGATANILTAAVLKSSARRFENIGTTLVQAGELELSAGGISSGDFVISSGAILHFSGGTHSLAATAEISGAGGLRISGGTVNHAGPVNIAGPATVSGGTSTFGTSFVAGGIGMTGGVMTLNQGVRINGALTMSGPAVLNLAPHGSRVLRVPSINASAPAVINVADNVVIVDYTQRRADELPTIVALLTSGYNGGAWNGPGINSSVAAAIPGRALGYAIPADIGSPTTFAGQTIDATSILIRYTLAGDADLNGNVVNVNDLGILASNWQQSGRRWSQGNFDYSADGLVDVNDLGILASNWQQSISGPGGSSSPVAHAGRTSSRAKRSIELLWRARASD
jgi:hypothetical protein